MKTNYSTAIHEASHCVTCFFLLAQTKGAVLFDSGGGICIDNPADAKVEMLTATPPAKEGAIIYGRRNVTARDLLNECIMLASGYVGTELLLGTSSVFLYDNTGDAQMIEANFLGCYPDASQDETTAFMCLVHAMTKPVIRKYEKYIRAVAYELSERKQLTASEVLQAMFPSVQIT